MAGNFYETDKALSEYLLFHYGKPDVRFPKRLTGNFPARCVTETIDRKLVPRNARALDLGCAVGRSAFELARFCREVVAIDYSSAFVAAAEKIRRRGLIHFEAAVEGGLKEKLVARAPAGIERGRVTFEQGDAMSLREDLGEFDVVVAANLIDRLSEPMRLLERLPGLVAARGQLVIASPYTWLEEYTPRRNWLGGVRGRTFDALREVLSPNFRLARRRDLPFLIREHARKFQLGVSEATVWIRKS